jgi:hypothetical protein
VFLDVDNLANSGAFDEQLWNHLQVQQMPPLRFWLSRASSPAGKQERGHVWTKGCMDRFLDGSDTADTDFVRKEYRLAMQLKKNMVAVKHEEFVFPDAASVPEEIRPVLKINAVPWVSQYKDAGLKKLMDSLILS